LRLLLTTGERFLNSASPVGQESATTAHMVKAMAASGILLVDYDQDSRG
jgi:hypothetical protein